MKCEGDFRAHALVLLLTASLGMSQQACRSESFPSTGQFLLSDSIDYLEPRPNSYGHLVILPELKFNCDGYITRWSALTQFASTENIIKQLPHDITFQLWRPSTRGDGMYTFVGSNKVEFFFGPTGESFTAVNDSFKLYNFTSVAPPEGQQRLYFQQGDVIGWYIHMAKASQFPLTIVHRHSTNEPGLNPVSIFTTVIADTDRGSTPPPCEVSLYSCGDQMFDEIRSVIPYVAVDYVISSTTPAETEPVCDNTSATSTSPSLCGTTSPSQNYTTVAPSKPVTLSPGAGGFGNVPIIIGVAGGLIAIITMATVIAIVVCLCVKSRMCVLADTHKGKDNYFYDNPLDESQVVNEGIYTLPDASTGKDDNTRTHAQPQTNLVGEGYTSTYVTGSDVHIYQELEMQPVDKRVSQSSILKPNPDYPVTELVFRASSDAAAPSVPTNTVPGCSPYTLPYTPASSNAHLEAMQSSSYHHLHTVGNTLAATSSNVASSAPSMAIFHSIENEGYHVPSTEQRMQFPAGDSTEGIYSRLSRPHSMTPRQSRDSGEMNFFEQSEFYWEPPSSTAELYNQLARRKYREIHRNQVHVLTALGSGYFGAVSRGYWEVPGGRMDVAIKFLQPGSKEEDKALFLQEAAIMGQFLHPNIVKLHGVVTVGEPLMIVLELMPIGDLKKYLVDLQNKVPNLPLDLAELFLNFCRQIGFGMNYLANKAFIHRDLAARNILLTQDLTCKIGDFGMTRALSGEEIYQSHGGKIPLKWTAPEALNYRRFTAGSDVWSYGMVLFEIWSLGQQPFSGVLDANKLMSLVNSGHCQAPPPGCPRAIYKLMVKCWNPVDERRPRFSKICDYLSVSDESLLNWSHEDRLVSPEVTHLGAPLSVTRSLYFDLQMSYSTGGSGLVIV